jgi:hypothetical protein
MNMQTEEEIKRTRAALDELIKNFKPNPRRVVFYHLKPFNDKIVEWRSLQASYNTIVFMLKSPSVKTSRARVGVTYATIHSTSGTFTKNSSALTHRSCHQAFELHTRPFRNGFKTDLIQVKNFAQRFYHR